MNDITFFNYHGKDIRTVEENNEFWWLLKDVCNVLELSNPRVVILLPQLTREFLCSIFSAISHEK